MIGRVFNESLDSDFLMQVGKFLNKLDTLSIYIQHNWFNKVNVNDIDYKDGRTYFFKLMGDVL